MDDLKEKKGTGFTIDLGRKYIYNLAQGRCTKGMEGGLERYGDLVP